MDKNEKDKKTNNSTLNNHDNIEKQRMSNRNTTKKLWVILAI